MADMYSKKKILFALLLYMLGFCLGYYFTANPASARFQAGGQASLATFSAFSFNNVFFTILLNNFLVAFVLSIVGFFSGSFITMLTLFWNGLILSFSIRALIYAKVAFTTILLGVGLHGSIEIFAFALFACYGFKGFSCLKLIFKNQPLSKQHIPPLRHLLLPSALLLVAAIVECIVIKYVHI